MKLASKATEAVMESSSQINVILPPSYNQLFDSNGIINNKNNTSIGQQNSNYSSASEETTTTTSSPPPSFYSLTAQGGGEGGAAAASEAANVPSSSSSSSSSFSSSEGGGAEFNLKDYLEVQLKNKYPIRYAIFHTITVVIVSLFSIALQIVQIALNGALSEVATGIWCGFIGLVTLVFMIITS